MIETDVVILGAGPGGAATAIKCALRGIRVVLVERSRFPRMAVGETLHPGVMPLLAELGVEAEIGGAGFLRHPGHIVQDRKATRFVAYGNDEAGPWLGLQAWRAEFDRILLSRAINLGAVVLQPETPHRILVENGRLVGVESPTSRIRSSFVIDATGRSRWLARQLGLKAESVGPRRIAWYGYVEGECEERSTTPALQVDAEGWTWIARVRPTAFQWTRLNFDGRRPEPGWLPPELASLKPCSPTRGADVSWTIACKPAGQGYFLVGDAGCVVDPASSHGVLRALMCGMMAGNLISKVVKRESTTLFAIESYSNWLQEWFRHDVARMTHLYAEMC